MAVIGFINKFNKLMFKDDNKVLVLLLGTSTALVVHGSSASTDCDRKWPIRTQRRCFLI